MEIDDEINTEGPEENQVAPIKMSSEELLAELNNIKLHPNEPEPDTAPPIYRAATMAPPPAEEVKVENPLFKPLSSQQKKLLLLKV